MVISAAINEIVIPSIKSDPNVKLLTSNSSFNCNNAAAIIVGIDINIENRAASIRLNPSARAAVMVTPERLVPGIIANTCAKPIMAAFLKLSLERLFCEPDLVSNQ